MQDRNSLGRWHTRADNTSLSRHLPVMLMLAGGLTVLGFFLVIVMLNQVAANDLGLAYVATARSVHATQTHANQVSLAPEFVRGHSSLVGETGGNPYSGIWWALLCLLPLLPLRASLWAARRGSYRIVAALSAAAALMALVSAVVPPWLVLIQGCTRAGAICTGQQDPGALGILLVATALFLGASILSVAGVASSTLRGVAALAHSAGP